MESKRCNAFGGTHKGSIVNFCLKGANFAVSGATALSLSFFQQNNVAIAPFNISLNVQIGWFQDLKPSFCNTTESCNDYFSKAMFILGEIGGNDYIFMLFPNKTLDFVRSYVPTVVDTINTAAEVLLKQGVMHLMLPGFGPMGCTPVILTLFASTNKSDYDSFGCLKKYNTISSYHSLLLSQAVTQLSAKYSKARIIFADYNGPVIAALQSPEIFGFNNGATLKVCCGGGGPYNFNLSAVCGQPGVISCENPSEYINWDGIHLTEAAYNAIASGWLKGPFANPPILGPL
ncbi:GDSL esterase/lipase [Rhynchospora pubera]|uniref:GDSL esterase/lipase n=1 Tax=Rhynchospora pubera TaxID=906938 RepID=A0AAV8CCZ3_9POAL|nr:GDSL esterase/lipase [Rhynchospora pubera]